MQVVYKNNMIPLFILETIEYAFILGKETAGILTVVSAMVLYNFPCDTSIWRQIQKQRKILQIGPLLGLGALTFTQNVLDLHRNM